MNNALKHSGARNVSIRLSHIDGETSLEVKDDGKGLDDSVIELRPGSVGIGLGGMRQRVKEFGGELQLQNTNPGTQVKITIPANAIAVHAAATHVSVRRS